MNRQITRFAVGGKWGGFGASGLTASAAVPVRCNRSSAASQPKPNPADWRNWRRDFSIHINELAHVVNQETKSRKRIPSQIIQRRFALGGIRQPAECELPTRLHLRLKIVA